MGSSPVGRAPSVDDAGIIDHVVSGGENTLFASQGRPDWSNPLTRIMANWSVSANSGAWQAAAVAVLAALVGLNVADLRDCLLPRAAAPYPPSSQELRTWTWLFRHPHHKLFR